MQKYYYKMIFIKNTQVNNNKSFESIIQLWVSLKIM